MWHPCFLRCSIRLSMDYLGLALSVGVSRASTLLAQYVGSLPFSVMKLSTLLLRALSPAALHTAIASWPLVHSKLLMQTRWLMLCVVLLLFLQRLNASRLFVKVLLKPKLKPALLRCFILRRLLKLLIWPSIPLCLLALSMRNS